MRVLSLKNLIPVPPEPSRFVNRREKFLLFSTTCSENRAIAQRVGEEFGRIRPQPPALRVFQAGSGDGGLLNRLLRHLHHCWPTMPFVVVVKEVDPDFARLAVRSLADRFAEHPDLVLVFTNCRYRTSLSGNPDSPNRVHWQSVALAGSGSYGFEAQINEACLVFDRGWNAPRDEPQVLVLFREDHAYALHDAIPQPNDPPPSYDLIVAAHAFRSRLPVAAKVDWVLNPLARQLRPDGRMIVVQSTGRDPAMKIINAVWPGENPFPTPRPLLVQALRSALDEDQFELEETSAPHAEFRFHLQLNPEDVQSSIGTSTLLAAWNAAVYVAQMDEQRLTETMVREGYLDAARRVLEAHRELWFTDECLVVSRG